MTDLTVSQAADTRRRIFAIVGASSGNLVEWFDFYIYSFLALYFSAAFFPSGNPTTQLLNTAGVFAAGFLMRPIGGWLFGRIADKHGRRNAMMISVLMMCGGSLVICFLPTYATIGAWAPILLLLARLFQGLSVGGEYGTSATYMSEVALKGRRGFFASFQYVTLIGGQLAALLVLVVLQLFLSTEELKAWGWRVPFFIGACAALISLYLRKSLDETTTAETRRLKEAGTLRGLMLHKRAFLTVVGFTAGGSLIFYTFTTYMQKYLVNTAGMPAKTASNVMTAALFVYMIMQPLFGALSDRIGRRNAMLCFGTLAHDLHGAAAACAERRDEPCHGFRAGGRRAGDRELLYVDQRFDQGRDVPAGSACARRRPVVCGRQCGVRRLGGIRRAVHEIDRQRIDVLLVRHRDVRDFADRFFPHARSEQGRIFAQRTLNVPVNRLHENARFWRRAFLFMADVVVGARKADHRRIIVSA